MRFLTGQQKRRAQTDSKGKKSFHHLSLFGSLLLVLHHFIHAELEADVITLALGIIAEHAQIVAKVHDGRCLQLVVVHLVLFLNLRFRKHFGVYFRRINELLRLGLLRLLCKVGFRHVKLAAGILQQFLFNGVAVRNFLII